MTPHLEKSLRTKRSLKRGAHLAAVATASLLGMSCAGSLAEDVKRVDFNGGQGAASGNGGAGNGGAGNASSAAGFMGSAAGAMNTTAGTMAGGGAGTTMAMAGSTAGGDPPSMAKCNGIDVPMMIQSSCGLCHTPHKDPSMTLHPVLTDGNFAQVFSTVPSMTKCGMMGHTSYVNMAKPEESVLYKKLLKRPEGHADHCGGVRMPYGPMGLKENQIACVLAWIKAGTPDVFTGK